MADVTVMGAHGSTISLSFDSSQNANLAQKIAAAISSGVSGGTILPADSKDGPPPPLPTGVVGEYVASTNVATALPQGYSNVVNAANAVIIGSGDTNESILSSGTGQLNFLAPAGSGTVVAGGGNNQIVTSGADKGAWLINTGNGNDTVRALGGGDDTVGAGGGSNFIQLGGGSDVVYSQGADTIFANSGSAKIVADTTNGSNPTDVIYGNSSHLFLIAAGGATVFGGSGSDTVFGGTGSDLLFGGTAGNNFLQAGSGPATLFGGGDGDQLYAGGNAAQELHAGTGNVTLFGGFAAGNDSFYGGSGNNQIFGGQGQNTFVLGTGSATISASTGAMDNVFEAIHGQAGGQDLVQGLTDASQVDINLNGYAPDEAATALAGQTTDGSSVTVTLSDNTRITFTNITHLTSGNFS
jgi:Ca2+-binding RTX toxin-like protein